MAKNMALRGLIYSHFPNESTMAQAMGWSRQRLNKITNGKKEPTIAEVQYIAVVLGVPFMDVARIFLQMQSPSGDGGGEENAEGRV